MSRSYGNPVGTGSFGSSAGTTVTGRPVTQNLTTQRYPRTDPKPRCIYCGQANHWVWECTHRNAQIPRKQTYPDEWRRYSAILTQKGRTDVKRLFNAFWIECLAEGRASGIRPPQTATGTSSEQNQSEQGVAAPVQPQHSHWQNMKDVLCFRCLQRGHFGKHCPNPEASEAEKERVLGPKRRSKRKTPYPITTYSVSEKRSADSVGKRRKLTPEEEEERAWGEPDVLFIEKREIKPRQPSDGLSESERQKRLKNWIGDSEKEEKDIYYQLEQKQLAEN
ncbi:hypothetical protein ADUPG1_002166, partial [Aduncisulcus paluster]